MTAIPEPPQRLRSTRRQMRSVGCVATWATQQELAQPAPDGAA